MGGTPELSWLHHFLLPFADFTSLHRPFFWPCHREQVAANVWVFVNDLRLHIGGFWFIVAHCCAEYQFSTADDRRCPPRLVSDSLASTTTGERHGGCGAFHRPFRQATQRTCAGGCFGGARCHALRPTNGEAFGPTPVLNKVPWNLSASICNRFRQCGCRETPTTV